MGFDEESEDEECENSEDSTERRLKEQNIRDQCSEALNIAIEVEKSSQILEVYLIQIKVALHFFFKSINLLI